MNHTTFIASLVLLAVTLGSTGCLERGQSKADSPPLQSEPAAPEAGHLDTAIAELSHTGLEPDSQVAITFFDLAVKERTSGETFAELPPGVYPVAEVVDRDEALLDSPFPDVSIPVQQLPHRVRGPDEGALIRTLPEPSADVGWRLVDENRFLWLVNMPVHHTQNAAFVLVFEQRQGNLVLVDRSDPKHLYASGAVRFEFDEPEEGEPLRARAFQPAGADLEQTEIIEVGIVDGEVVDLESVRTNE